MKKYKQAALTLAFLTMILTAGLTAGQVKAENLADGQDAAYQEERVLDAFEKEDYEGWKDIVIKKNSAYSSIGREDFDRFIAIRRAARAGQYDKTIKLAKRLEQDLEAKIA